MARSGVTLEVVGLNALQKVLDDLPEAVGARVLRKAVSKAGRPVVNAFRANVKGAKKSAKGVKGGALGKVTGKLSRSPWMKVKLYGKSRRRGRTAVAIIGPKSGEAPHLHLLEFGTRRGVRAYAPLRRAWKSQLGNINRIMEREIKAGVFHEAEKLKRKHKSKK